MDVDIKSREDIEKVVTSFYEKAMYDNIIGHFFTGVVELNLESHLPTIVDFWEGILLGEMKYKGNPMLKHISLHRKSPLTRTHFDRWLLLWKATIDLQYKGEKAEQAKKSAVQIAELMLHKINFV